MKIGVILPAAQVDEHGGTPNWRTVHSFAQAAESHGLDSVWMFDHFFDRSRPWTQAMQEAWTIVSAVAAVTQRVEIGTLALCSSFRNPGLVAKMAVTADDVSGERLILGLGAGWHDEEYHAFGYPTDHRVDRFEEALQIIGPLLRGTRVSFQGGITRSGMRSWLQSLAGRSGSWSRETVRGCSGSPPGMQTHGTPPGSGHLMRNYTGLWRRSPQRSKPKAEIRRPSRGPWG